MKSILIIAVLILAVASLSWAQDNTKKPNFSGTWKLSAEKSETPGLPAPAWVLTIKHQEPNLEVGGTVDGKAVAANKGEIGGKETSLNSECCGAGTLKVWWEGQSLVSEFKWEKGTQKDVRTLSADSKTLTIIRTINQEGQDKERTLKLVFEKQ